MDMKRKRHPLYVLFLLLMCLLLAGGVALLIYGSTHHGVAAPRLPWLGPLANAPGRLHV